MKRRDLYILFVMIVITIFITTLFFYNILSDSNINQVQNLDELNNISENYIYFGRPSCPSCKIFLPILELVSKDYNKKILYFNSDFFRNETDVKDEQLLEVFSKYKVERIPLISYIENDMTKNAFGAIFNISESASIYEEVQSFIEETTGRMLLPFHQKLLIALVFVSITLTVYLIFLRIKLVNEGLIKFLIPALLLIISSTSIIVTRVTLMKDISIEIDLASYFLLSFLIINCLIQTYLILGIKKIKNLTS